MVQRDYLEAQIEQLGRALARIVAEFLGTRSHGDGAEAIAVANESLKEQLDVNVDSLIGHSTADLANYLAQRNLAGERLSPLARVPDCPGRTQNAYSSLTSPCDIP